jgi:hypothetical protein
MPYGKILVDEVESSTGKILTTGEVASELEAIARSLNVVDGSVIYGDDTTTSLDSVNYIYDTSVETVWAVPTLDSTGKTLVSVVGDTLTTTGGTGSNSYTLTTINKSGIEFATVADIDNGASMGGKVTLIVGDRVVALDYAAGNNSGLLFFKVVASGTGTDDGGKYIDLPTHGLQLEQNLRLPYNIKAWGAVGDGTTDDQPVIQKVVDYANSVYVANGSEQQVEISDGTFLVDVVNYIKDDDVTVLGITSVKMKDGVHILGNGTVKVKAGAYGGGAFYRCFSSRDTNRLTNASITGITVDGDKANQVASVQCSNILLECAENVHVRNVRSINANGQGIQLRGVASDVAEDLSITNCHVKDSSNIAIQSSQFKGLVISGNYVINATDNGIDIYGDDGTSTPTSEDFAITGNTVVNTLVGLFHETVFNGTTTGNVVSDSTFGTTINRINGEPSNITISGNTLYDNTSGFRVTGDTGGVFFTGNTVTGFTDSGIEIGGGGNASRVMATNNFLSPANATTPLVKLGGTTVSFCIVRDNITDITDSAYYLENNASSTVGVITEDPDQLTSNNKPFQTGKTGITVSSGGTFTIPAPSNASGILTIRGSSGGAWQSVWTGTIVTEGSRVDVTQTTTDFTTTGNTIASVAGDAASLDITVTHASTGSNGSFSWWIEYIK